MEHCRNKRGRWSNVCIVVGDGGTLWAMVCSAVLGDISVNSWWAMVDTRGRWWCIVGDGVLVDISVYLCV
jgi:hypothetical protein